MACYFQRLLSPANAADWRNWLDKWENKEVENMIKEMTKMTIMSFYDIVSPVLKSEKMIFFFITFISVLESCVFSFDRINFR